MVPVLVRVENYILTDIEKKIGKGGRRERDRRRRRERGKEGGKQPREACFERWPVTESRPWRAPLCGAEFAPAYLREMTSRADSNSGNITNTSSSSEEEKEKEEEKKKKKKKKKKTTK